MNGQNLRCMKTSKELILTEAPISLNKLAKKLYGNNGHPLSREKRNELLIKGLPFVKYIVSKFQIRLPHNISVDVLTSAGVLGLLDATIKFDPLREIEFKTYAEFRIKGAIIDELRGMDQFSRSIREKGKLLEETRDQFEKDNGRPAGDEEMAELLDLCLEDYYVLFREVYNAAFADNIIKAHKVKPDNSSDPGLDLFNNILAQKNFDPVELIENEKLKLIFVKALEALNEDEKIVMSLYYYDELTMLEIGSVMDLTESRVCQIHTKVIIKLNKRLSFLAEEI